MYSIMTAQHPQVVVVVMVVEDKCSKTYHHTVDVVVAEVVVEGQ